MLCCSEILHRLYSMKADIWSIDVTTSILSCRNRPFWARTESGIFSAVLRADPNFEDAPWPSVSPEAKDFVKRQLHRDHWERMTAEQASSIYGARKFGTLLPHIFSLISLISSETVRPTTNVGIRRCI
ncbi:CDPK-related kinase 1 [Nymphaea thermarum]|nr:CDPK-related kinase 1 [Nymphaea thermarum]